MANLLDFVTGGRNYRKSRFHDESGNLIPLRGMLYAPHALITAALRVRFGHRLERPWLSYRAQRFIANLIQPDWTLLEFGSGMSTAWLALRCGSLYSIEHNPEWFHFVQDTLTRRQLSNVHYSLREENYADLSGFPDHCFDFVLIDGIVRAQCVCNALPKIREGGWIYLDNTDRREFDYQEAKRTLLDTANHMQRIVRYYTDFVTGNFLVTQGILVQL